MEASLGARNFRYVADSVWLCFFPIASIVIALLILLGIPQGREVLDTVSDARLRDVFGHPYGLVHYLLFLSAFVAWGMANWYAARLLLQKRFHHSSDVWAAKDTRFMEYWRKWFPRVLAIAGTLPIALDILRRGQWLAGGLALTAVGFLLVYFVKRRKLFKVQDDAKSLRASLADGDQVALWVTLAISSVLMIGLGFANYWLARLIGAPALVFLALAAITLVGSIVLIYLPLAYGMPSLAWLPFVLFLLVAQFKLNRNHAIDERAPTVGAWQRPLVSVYFNAWPPALDSEPIVLVAAEGGGSRSAWWTAHVLSALEQVTDGLFSKRVFAVSGISGGSLGAATYVALLQHRTAGGTAPTAHQVALHFPRDGDCERLYRNRAALPMAMQSECFLGRDFLSTTIGYLLFPDLLQRLLPKKMPRWDRSFGLERTWEIDWVTLFGTNTFAEPMQALYATPGGTLRSDLPIMLLNSARASAGRPVLQAPVVIPSADFDDLFREGLRPQGLALSAAVHNSARFPIFSPGGEVHFKDGGYWDALVDGGYFENSGAAALHEMLREIERVTGTKGWPALRNRLVLVYISNDPEANTISDPCAAPGPGDPKDGKKPINQEELLTPPIGLYQARTARADAARRALANYVGACESGPRVYTLAMNQTALGSAQPAMSWYMTPESRRAMWSAVHASSVSAPLCALARRVYAKADCSRLNGFENPDKSA